MSDVDPGSAPLAPDQILLKDYRPRSIYRIPETRVEKARFPAIDVHAHVYARTPEEVDQWVRTMDEVGLQQTVVFTGTVGEAFDAVARSFSRYPSRFSVWCGIDLSRLAERDFGQRAVAELKRCRDAGAKGVGELVDKGRGFGRRLLPPDAAAPHVDDPRLDPVWEACAELRLPVNIHVAEDRWMYEPMDATNDGLMNAYKWRIPEDPDVPRHEAMIATLDRTARKHPRTTFVAAHFANCCYDLSILGEMLDACPNLSADISARYGETAPIPRTMRAFYEKYQDRLLYGTDMGAGAGMYRDTFRILESEDEHFYRAGFNYHWPLHGFGLSDEVLRKLYGENARRILGLGG